MTDLTSRHALNSTVVRFCSTHSPPPPLVLGHLQLSPLPWSSPGCYCVTQFGYGAAAANELKVDLEEARLFIPLVSGLPTALQASHCTKDKDTLSRAFSFST